MFDKILFSLCIGLMFSLTAPSQNNLGATADLERIAVTPIVPNELTDIPQPAKSILVNRLQLLANTHGFGGFSYQPQFVLVARPVVVEKQVSATVPVMIRIELETTLYLADYNTKTVFSTTSVSMSGVGSTDVEAYRNAFRTLKTHSPELTEFMKKGREGVISFYNSRCDFILGKADMLDSAGQSEAALSLLLGVPEVCKDCFKKAVNKSGNIYQASLERQCQALVQNARSKWSASPNRNGGVQASVILAMIPPNTKCAQEAGYLNDEIMAKMFELEEWDRKVYEDEQAMQLKVYEDKREVQLMYLKTLRDVGVAQAENQPDVVYKIRYGGWLW